MFNALWMVGGNLKLIRFIRIGMLEVGILNLIKPGIIRRKNNYNTIVVLALLPWAIAATWYFIFENHTVVHPWFMGSLVSFALLSGIVVIFGYIIDALQKKACQLNKILNALCFNS